MTGFQSKRRMAESRYKVYCEWCQDWHYVDEVEVLNVEEDIQGRDVMHYTCPITEQPTKSLVYRK